MYHVLFERKGTYLSLLSRAYLLVGRARASYHHAKCRDVVWCEEAHSYSEMLFVGWLSHLLCEMPHSLRPSGLRGEAAKT
jgi:hypothetical protein